MYRHISQTMQNMYQFYFCNVEIALSRFVAFCFSPIDEVWAASGRKNRNPFSHNFCEEMFRLLPPTSVLITVCLQFSFSEGYFLKLTVNQGRFTVSGSLPEGATSLAECASYCSNSKLPCRELLYDNVTSQCSKGMVNYQTLSTNNLRIWTLPSEYGS